MQKRRRALYFFTAPLPVHFPGTVDSPIAGSFFRCDRLPASGAVLAAGLMIYALVWGDEAASRTFRASILRAVVVCSLGFYCLAKSYSFFTGANHLHSIISPGTPGNILSGGLILPLNVAVGLVVCCTMYSFYMYFRRGEL